MSDIFLEDEEIEAIFKQHLKVESMLVSIESLFANARRFDRIDYKPYYQRNYVWDSSKASYFIESILLGTEIPPLIFFDNGIITEVIDGRQRFETINRFVNQQIFSLNEKGLLSLKTLGNKKFNDLSKELKDTIWETKLRIIQFSIVNEPRLNERKEDLIKKEIFRRYNSGITPLKEVEIDRAKYIDEEVTKGFKKYLKLNDDFYKEFISLFFTERDLDKRDKENTIERVLDKIRFLLVLHNIPINYYATLKGRNDIINHLFEYFSENLDNLDICINEFTKKVNILSSLHTKLKNNGTPVNRLIFECMYWLQSILEVEGQKLSAFFSDKKLEEIAILIRDNISFFSTENSLFRKNVLERYTFTINLIPADLNINKNIYLVDSKLFKKKYSEEIAPESKLKDELENHKVVKADAQSIPINDIITSIQKGKYIIRPAYQRPEVINYPKSSAIIESILLGIPLPPIFIYKREDGLSEVVDGQQRILTILGYMHKTFKDDKGDIVQSEKNNFKLTNLRILKELKGKSFDELEQKYQDKIYDFNISIVTIDYRLNSQFEPVDLFIRLNNKPYPIKEDTFEMWNSYIDKELIRKIKDNTKKNNSWFFYRVPSEDKRMTNEELYTTLAFLNYKKLTNCPSDDYVAVFTRESRINIKLKEKADVTKALNQASGDIILKNKFDESINRVEKLISKLKILLIDKEYDDSNLSKILKDKLNDLMQIERTPRRMTNFYTLWYLFDDINIERVKIDADILREDLKSIFMQSKTGFGDSPIETFKSTTQEFKNKYMKDKRALFLSDNEKKALLKSQNYICPICNGKLFQGHDIEVDHIIPIAKGGKDDLTNLQLAHLSCNRTKGSKNE